MKDISSLGYKFFVIQIAGVILFTTTNVLIAQFFGPGEVTPYNIAFKYFSVVAMIYGIIIAPFWSSITDAYARKELQWIKAVIIKLNSISSLFIVLCILMLFVADRIFLLWVGPSIKVPMNVSVMMAIYFIINLLAGASNAFINGTGKIKIQFLASIFAIIVTIPLAFLFCKYLNYGPSGIIAATLCTTLPCTILYRIQYKKIINGTAKGIWNA
jgi:O-antigen/teichoic acid export membrane protein